MNGAYENAVNEQGVRFHIVPTKKFKTISITAKFKARLSRDTITKRALLPLILQQGTESYPDRSALQIKLDSLYGAVLTMNSSKKGHYHIMTISLETANQKFISDESAIMDEAIALLKEAIFNPNRQQDSFFPSVVAREKDTLKQKINAIADDKMRYANMRLLDEMCSEERYKLHVHGYVEDLESITPENLYAYYCSMLQEDQLDIYAAGDVDRNEMEKKLKSVFHRDDYNRSVAKEDDTEKLVNEPQTIVEKQNIQQAKLHFGYRTHIAFQDHDYFALHVFNGLFGGFPSSKLFTNVREKNSLAYYAASRFESHKGLLFVFSGIAPEDYQQAREIIEQQVEAMKNGDFTEEEMANTKELIVNQLLETMDHSKGMIELMYQQVAADTERSPDALIDGIKNVSKDEVVQVANKLMLDTIYLLTNQGGDTDE
ncbi:EF-P 5-aminopentanol modification-associated protein YfmF [Lentibacillus sp. CBA3610]|uniref:EF-P 5-aminopentanol modification-associated protein YfmF n=1 Tax=Lentibacillus sp. CBA3610 TaxID=2518176 RepID=UPI0015956D9C|nr:pitrilysin family protein [Lentibacillus sp. CBA3610]QKY69080.1 insulinase family protein [Lentibacillus sp. CBA3610]